MLTLSTRPHAKAPAPSAGRHPSLAKAGDWPTPATAVGVGRRRLALPFDAMRAQYAGAVIAGLARRSLRASGRREREIDTPEKPVLRPLARQR